MSRSDIAASWRLLTAADLTPPQDYSWSLEAEAFRWTRAVSGLPSGALEEATRVWLERGRPGLYPGHHVPEWPTPRLICLCLPRPLMRRPPSPGDAWRGPIGCVIPAHDVVRDVVDSDLSRGRDSESTITLVDRGWSFWASLWDSTAHSHPALADRTRVSIRLLGFHPRWPSPPSAPTQALGRAPTRRS